MVFSRHQNHRSRTVALAVILVLCMVASNAWSRPDAATSRPLTSSPPPAETARTEIKRLVGKFGTRLLGSRYMERDCRPTTYPQWAGFPLQRCHYSVVDHDGTTKTADVIMLNPSPEQVARWIVDACWRVRGKISPEDTDKLFTQVIQQSGGQFPVAGVVYEDIIPADGVFEIYCFRNGVTVSIDGVPHRGTAPLTSSQVEASLFGRVTNVFKYGRIQSTTPGQYLRNGGSLDVGTDEKRTLLWPEAVRQLYQKAWGQDRNDLMIAWARENL